MRGMAGGGGAAVIVSCWGDGETEGFCRQHSGAAEW